MCTSRVPAGRRRSVRVVHALTSVFFDTSTPPPIRASVRERAVAGACENSEDIMETICPHAFHCVRVCVHVIARAYGK